MKREKAANKNYHLSFLVFLSRSIVALLAMLLSAVDSTAQGVTIGLLSEETGTFAPNGEDCRAGYEAAKRLFKTTHQAVFSRLRLITGDSQGDGRAAITEFRKFVDRQKAIAVITNRSQVGMALNPLSKQRQIPLLGIVGHSEFVSGNPYAWRMFPSAKVEGEMIAEWARELAIKKLAVATAEDEWLSSLSNNVSAEFARRGGIIVRQERVLENQIDLASVVERLKQSEPDGVYVSFGIGQSAVMLRRMYELGLRKPVFSNGWSAKREVIEIAGRDAMDGVRFVEPVVDPPWFSKLLKDGGVDRRITTVSLSCFVALSFLFQTFAAEPTISSSEELYQALQRRDHISTPDGVIKIVDREAQFLLEPRQVHNGEVVKVMPLR